MTEIISFSASREVKNKTEQLCETLHVNRSKLIRDMVEYFYERRGNLQSGLIFKEDDNHGD